MSSTAFYSLDGTVTGLGGLNLCYAWDLRGTFSSPGVGHSVGLLSSSLFEFSIVVHGRVL